MPGSWLSIRIGFASIGLVLGVSVASGAADSASGALQIGAERFALKCVFAVMEQDGVAAGKEKLTGFFVAACRCRTSCARHPTTGFTGPISDPEQEVHRPWLSIIALFPSWADRRSEEHTSELQSLR